MDQYIDGVVPTPITPEEKGFALGMLIGNLRRIHAAYDDEGEDLSALPAKAADEIERLRELNKVLEAGFFEAAKQIAKSDPAGVALWLREQGFMTQNAR